ncbi:MAG: DUF1993 domain-containing protein [Betaproteobacteria bacterium]|nr:MAG: DUF1993 domain-containing protein [Betaproteobacteria bacterium]
MTISMYQASVPVLVRALTNLKGILNKAAAHAQAKKIDEAALLNARLFPDMFMLTRQVQIACDFARATGARLAGKEPLALEETEKSIAELVARIDRSIDYIGTLAASDIDGSEAREIVRPIRGEPKRFTGINYLLQFALPNFFFHVTTAYAILRHSGIDIGKADYIGALD